MEVCEGLQMPLPCVPGGKVEDSWGLHGQDHESHLEPTVQAAFHVISLLIITEFELNDSFI